MLAEDKDRNGRHGVARRIEPGHDGLYTVSVVLGVIAFILAVYAYFAAIS